MEGERVKGGMTKEEIVARLIESRRLGKQKVNPPKQTIRQFAPEDVLRAKDYLIDDSSLDSFRLLDGSELNDREIEHMISRIIPNAFDRTGRKRVVLRNRNIVDYGYECRIHLAGTIYVCTESEYLGEIKLETKPSACGNQDCGRSRYTLCGGRYDGVVVMFSSRKIDVSIVKAMLKEDFTNDYMYAVRVARIIKTMLGDSKIAAMYGPGFRPRSLFAEAVVLLFRMRWAKDIRFFHYADYAHTFDVALSASPGYASALSTLFYMGDGVVAWKMSNYMWSFHILGRLRAKFPYVPLMVDDWLTHIDSAARSTVVWYKKRLIERMGIENDTNGFHVGADKVKDFLDLEYVAYSLDDDFTGDDANYGSKPLLCGHFPGDPSRQHLPIFEARAYLELIDVKKDAALADRFLADNFSDCAQLSACARDCKYTLFDVNMRVTRLRFLYDNGKVPNSGALVPDVGGRVKLVDFASRHEHLATTFIPSSPTLASERFVDEKSKVVDRFTEQRQRRRVYIDRPINTALSQLGVKQFEFD